MMYLHVFTIALPDANSEFTPENQWLEDGSFPLGACGPFFRGELLVFGMVINFNHFARHHSIDFGMVFWSIPVLDE